MRAVVLTFLLVAAPVLSGCLGGDDAGDVLTNQSFNDTDDTPVKLPDNRSGEFLAFQETNRTDDYGAHRHDYWNGATRVTIHEETVHMDGWTDGAYEDADPEPGTLVYEGTGKVEVLLENPRRSSCPYFVYNPATECGGVQPDPGVSSGIAVSFLHAASDPDGWIDAGVAQWGVPLVIDVVDPTWTDMPHSSGTLWRFAYESRDPADANLVFDTTITIIKSGEPAQWPGHPVFYDEDTRYRKIYDDRVTVEEGRLSPAWNSMDPAKLVSAGTKTLLVWANITQVEGRPYEPTHWSLWFHNATTDDWSFTTPFDDQYAAGQASYLWKIPVDADGMDGPYATQSRWEFFVRGAFTSPVVSCIYGCVDYSVEYDFTIIATDIELDEEAYSEVRN